MPEDDAQDPLNLRVLRILVTVLTVTMIVGLITIVAVFVTRFPRVASIDLPPQIALPEDETATAVTVGPGWYAVVTAGSRILVFDSANGALVQTVEIETGN